MHQRHADRRSPLCRRARITDGATRTAAELARLGQRRAVGRTDRSAAVDRQRHRLHLLDDDLSWLARNRDHHRTGNIPAPSGHEEFVRRLAQRNQRWIDSTQTLSRSCTTSKSGKRRGQPETITSKTTTCPWCCARSSGASAPIPSSSASWHHHRCADCRHRRLDVDQDRNRMGPR